jgi:hypothetical protein
VATPGMYGLQAPTGGFFSLQFDAPNREWYESEGPASLDGFYDLTTGQFITFNQDSDASIFLQASNSDPFSAAGHLRRRNCIKTITIYPPNATTASFAISTRLSFSYYLDYAYFIHLVLPTKHDGGGIDFLEVHMNAVYQFLLAGYPDSSQHGSCHLAELVLDKIQP